MGWRDEFIKRRDACSRLTSPVLPLAPRTRMLRQNVVWASPFCDGGLAEKSRPETDPERTAMYANDNEPCSSASPFIINPVLP